jgi:gamma-glutamyl:cysteine ligase YbdK (ATP-grasp superfamily)
MPHKSLASSPALKGGASARQNLVKETTQNGYNTWFDKFGYRAA